jgi:hypothetical protein
MTMNDKTKPLSRRTFCAGTIAALGHFAFATDPRKKVNGYVLVKRTDRARILRAAAQYVDLAPRTITSYSSPRSPGGPHDYFSQADYFWPNPADPDGKYINRDGQSNPDNFNDHRKAMIALSIQMSALTAAWLLTRDPHYGKHAADHLRAWFITPDTRMNPTWNFLKAFTAFRPDAPTASSTLCTSSRSPAPPASSLPKFSRVPSSSRFKPGFANISTG